MTTRFDLEQQILQTWGIVEDLQSVLGVKDLSLDRALQLIEALATITDFKFQKLFRTYETLIAEKKL